MKILISSTFMVFIAFAVSSAAEVADTVKTIEAGNTGAKNLNPAGTYCKDCSSDAKEPYETCNEKNNYYESAFQKLLEGKSSNYYHIRAGHFIPEQEYNKIEMCIQQAMKIHRGPFRQCAKDGVRLAMGRSAEACLSKNYVQTTTDSFVAATDCYSGYLSQPESTENNDLVRRGLFSLLSYESGFHTNAVSTTGSIGIGQFTSGTINGVNQHILDDVLNYAKASNKSSCQAIAKQNIQPYSNPSQNRCSLIAPQDGNPLKNLIYVIGIQKHNRLSLEKTMATMPAKAREAIANASPEFREKLINLIVNWSHNTGIGGVRRPFTSFASSQRGLALIEKGDIQAFARELSPVVGSYHENYLIKCSSDDGEEKHARCERTKKARISEVSRFYRGILERQNDINREAGNLAGDKKCGV